jgi:adenylate cyclase
VKSKRVLTPHASFLLYNLFFNFLNVLNLEKGKNPMAEKGFKRKLTAILSADVEGYSRLMGEDEETTVRTITAYREVMTTLIQQHSGKVLDSPGDNLLAEFASVVDAVQCAVAVQKEINARNTELPENRKMQFRIGINLGDVIQEGDRIYGDGVNIAARLEGLAEPGGVCISKTAFDHIESKLPYGYNFIGDQTVKNIAKPVGAYRVLMEPRVTVEGKPKEEKPAPMRRMSILVGAVAVLVLALAVGIWQFYMRRPSVEPASVEKMAYPLPDKPSIAVLPFVNMSGDSEQEYFSDGLTEEIITALSKIRNVFVIARNSTFSYKSKPVKVQQVAEELGVRYVIEGSIRKAEDRVRITAQLIDALTGYHLWAERYDRKLEDIFAVQDEITEEIVTALDIKLVRGEQARLWRKSLKNPKARDFYYRGREKWHRSTKESLAEARQLFEQVIELEPDSPLGYVGAAQTHWFDAWRGFSKDPARSFKRAAALADAHAVLGWIYVTKRQFEKAIVEGERAVGTSPNGADIHFGAAIIFMFYGTPNEAIILAKKAMRLNPIPPVGYFNILGVSYRESKQYEESISTLKEGIARDPEHVQSRYALVTEEARFEAREILKINPRFDLEQYTKRLPYKDREVNERLLTDLRKAGLL